MPPDVCPDPDRLAAFHAGRLPAGDIDAVAAHLEGCPACEAVLQGLEGRTGPVAEAVRAPITDIYDPPAGAGTVVGGRYKLAEPLGEGGMGAVWMAQQTEPVKRAVAVKLIKPGMDSKAVLARFAAERQALALMDHPNIAKVLDAGQTEAGRPFFAMELVKGVPITAYCDQHRLTPRERLALFVPVCRAVQHAHQKGVIHRDIKPSNVLVARYDGVPVPKVIDFGIAKAAGQPLTDKTLMTGFGAVVGTPEYMAPEQAELNQLDIDTRADVYALGVLLYELLTGSTPLTRARAQKAAVLEVLRLVREEEPPAPSSRLSTADALPSIAASRGTEPKRLAALLKGELDWVVLKALEKDRGRRYETASGLARDVERYLADEPVEAGRPSAAHRLRKFARRNRGPVLATGLLVGTLLAGLGGTGYGLVRAESRRQEAERARAAEAEQRAAAEDGRRAEAEQRQRAEAKEAEANAVVRFFQERVFAAARPKGAAGLSGGQGKDVTVRAAIAASLPALDAAFADRPLVEARLRFALGLTFNELGDPAAGLGQNERAAAAYARVLGPDHPDTLAATNLVANSLFALGRHPDALRVYGEVLAGRRRVLGPEHPDTLASVSNFANAQFTLGRYPDAERLYEEAAAGQRRVLGPDHPDVLVSLSNLANAHQALGRGAAALRLRQEVLAGQRRVLGPDHTSTLSALDNLALSLSALGRPADAVPLLQEAADGRRRVLGPDHPDTLSGLNNLADALAGAGRHAEALTAAEEAVRGARAKLGADHPQAILYTATLAEVLAGCGRSAEAIPLIDEHAGRAAGGSVNPVVLPALLAVRRDHFRRAGDAAGCRATAEMWERAGRGGAGDLYAAARYRAAAAGLYAKAGQVAEAAADGDRAMGWLTKAVAAGYKNRSALAADPDLAVLRDRADFRALLASLPEQTPQPRPVR